MRFGNGLALITTKYASLRRSVMNQSKLPKLLLMLALVAGLCMVQPRLNAQQERDPAAAQQQQPDPGQDQSMKQAADMQNFAGRVIKMGGKYVLGDTASKATYALDDQDKAKQFEGQAVQVTGTLDAQTRTIRVSSMTPGS
jgi:hypothetical protein